MRHTNLKWLNEIGSALTRTPRSRTRRLTAVLAMLIGAVALAVVVRAYNHEPEPRVQPAKLSTALPSAFQTTSPGRDRRLLSRLSFQPEANKMRRRLGKKFVEPGREVTVSTGTLTIGADHQPIRIVRTQDAEEGEQVSIAIGANSAFTWSPKAGAVSNGNILTSNERAIVERIALDSPDQFTLAQTRGASYYTIARTVRPAEAGDSEKYSGPLWDLIRIDEPQRGDWNKPESLWRVYYVNNVTGLIDRVFCQEGGETLTADLSEWVDHGGELEPSLIRWSRGGNVVMQLSVINVSHGPKG